MPRILLPGNPRQSQSGTSSGLPRPVDPRTLGGPTCVSGSELGSELTSCLPRGHLACFCCSPNISGFSLVLNLSRKNPFLPKVTMSSVPSRGPLHPQGGGSLTPESL